MYRARSGQRTRRSWGSPGWILCIYIYIYTFISNDNNNNSKFKNTTERKH